MAYVPMDISALQRVQAPRADVLGSLLGGQKVAAQQQALAGMSDPMDRYNLLFGKSTTPRKKSVFEMRQEAISADRPQQILKEYNQIATEAIQKRVDKEKANISKEMGELGFLAMEYKSITQQSLPTELSVKAIDDMAAQRKMGQNELEFDAAEEEKAYTQAVVAFNNSIGKVKDAGAQMAKVWPLLNEAAKGNNASAVAAVKILTQSLDNSAVMAGEMDVLGDPSLVGKLSKFLNAQEKKQSFTAKELEDIYNTGIAIAKGVNGVLASKGKLAKDIYTLRAGSYANEGGGALDKYVSSMVVGVPKGPMPTFVSGTLSNTVNKLGGNGGSSSNKPTTTPNTGVTFTGAW